MRGRARGFFTGALECLVLTVESSSPTPTPECKGGREGGLPCRRRNKSGGLCIVGPSCSEDVGIHSGSVPSLHGFSSPGLSSYAAEQGGLDGSTLGSFLIPMSTNTLSCVVELLFPGLPVFHIWTRFHNLAFRVSLGGLWQVKTISKEHLIPSGEKTQRGLLVRLAMQHLRTRVPPVALKVTRAI